jgi:uncharacterized protein (TIGR03437 family)
MYHVCRRGGQTSFSVRSASGLIFSLLAIVAVVCWQNWPAVRASGQADHSPDGLWQELAARALATPPLSVAPGRHFRAVRLNRQALLDVLKKAPHENTQALAESQSVLSLPLPDGKFARFRLEESPAMEPALAAKFPAIKSYRGVGADDSSLQVRLDWSPRGLHALMLKNERPISVEPLRNGDDATYVSFYGQDAVRPQDFECLIEQLPTPTAQAVRAVAPRAFSFGNVRRNFRIAIATTVEYTNAPNLGGGSVASALASVNTWLNAVNLIYERELSMHFNLVANNDRIIFAESDFLSNGSPNLMLSEVRGILSQTIGVTNYDLGHVLGTGTGGTANLGVVCVDSGFPGPFKGGGVSLIHPTATVGNSFYITRIAHEIGHQFGATHSYSDADTNYACNSGRNSISAWESGSGLTIMSFAGSCNPIATGRALHFHGGSLAQIAAFLQNNALCAQTVNVNNNLPTVNGGNDFRIPRNTPFALTATGNDLDPSDKANLTYSWEQLDAGGVGFGNPAFTDANDVAGTTRPIFRPYAPSRNPMRVFPELSYILYHANVPPLTQLEHDFEVFTGESLPNVTRTLNFKVTVRDGRGGVADDDVLIEVDGNSGPFAVTAPNDEVIWEGGSKQTVTWSVNGTNVAPINAANVRITLSTDGGFNFPITLFASTPNDGSEMITVPSGLTAFTARVKVEAIGNIFFDLSDTNFSLTPGSPACPTVASLNPTNGQAGVAVMLTGANFTGVTAVRFNNNLNANFTLLSDTQIRVSVPTGATTGPLTLVKADCGDSQTSNFTIAACTYALNATVRNVSAAAITSNVTITTGANCGWTAESHTPWVTIISGATGNGTRLVNFSIAGNTGQARSGTLTMAGQTVTVTQTVGCAFALSPTLQNLDGPGGTSSVTVTTGANCPWTAVSTFPWITINAGKSGSGPGTVAFTVSPNNGLERAGSLTIAGQNSTVTQSSYCNFSITPTERDLGAAATSTTVNVQAGLDCNWVSASTVNWLTVAAGANGISNAPVVINAAANTGPPRTGLVVVAGQAFTVNQAGGCTYTLSRASQDFNANGGTNSFNVTAGAGCAWSVTNNADWIRINSGASGTGNGTVNFTATANTGPARTAMLVIADKSFTVSQAANCAVTLSPTTRNVTAPAVTGTLNVAAAASCAWTAVSNADWITLTGNTSGAGNSTVAYAIAANTGAARIGTLSIGGATFTVTQAAATCAYTFSPASQHFEASGANASVDVTTAGYCAWTATSNAGWLTITSGSGGLGNGPISYNVAPNTGPARSAALTISGQAFNVTQAAGCGFTLNTSQQNAAAAGELLSVNVATHSICPWRATSDVYWITVLGEPNRSGPGLLNYEVQPNPGAARTGTLTVAGQRLTIVQGPGGADPPLVTALSPTAMPSGNGRFTLVVRGLNFSSDAIVLWQGVPRTTIWINNTQLHATILMTDVINPGLANVSVFDPHSQTISNSSRFLISGRNNNVSAASYASTELAPEQIIAVFGTDLASASASATTVPLPTTLAGTTVQIKDSAGRERLAPLFFVAANQINYLLPAGSAPGPATVTIISGEGQISVGEININHVAPGLFSADSSGRGVAAGFVLRVLANNTQRIEPLARFDATQRVFVPVPIDLGAATDQVFLVLYGTGWRGRSDLSGVNCTIGGTSGAVSFAGAQGTLLGLDQLNVLLPRSLAGRGEVEIGLTVDGKQANSVKVQIR